MRDRIVVKLSGSLFGADLSTTNLKGFSNLFKEQLKKGFQTVLVAGGGEASRRYISLARSLGADEASLDIIGIEASRLNARLLMSALGDACYQTVPTTLDEVLRAVENKKVVVVGGLHPGQSTNAVAAIIAERIRAKLFINTTDVDGVYTSDPNLDKSAKLLRSVTVARLKRLLDRGVMGAGTYELMDLIALKVIERSKIQTRIVKCSVDAVRAALRGEEVGTKIVFGG